MNRRFKGGAIRDTWGGFQGTQADVKTTPLLMVFYKLLQLLKVPNALAKFHVWVACWMKITSVTFSTLVQILINGGVKIFLSDLKKCI